MTNENTINPIYLEAVEAYLHSNFARIQVLLESDKLSLIEKELIHARLFIRNKDWKAAQARLADLNSDSDFYLGEIHFLLGTIHGFNGNWEQAILENTQAYQHFDTCEDQRGLFLAAYNLSFDYSNLELFQVSSNYLSLAQENIKSEQQLSQVLRGLAWNSLNMNQIQESLKFIEQGSNLTGQIDPTEKDLFLITAAEIYFRIGQSDTAFEMLKTLKDSKFLKEKSRVYFEYRLLEKLKFEKLPYRNLDLSAKEVHLSGEYRLKWLLVKSLLNQDHKMAENYWSQLCFLFPKSYGPNFSCRSAIESNSIFMTFVNKVLEFNSASTVSQESFEVVAAKTEFELIKIV